MNILKTLALGLAAAATVHAVGVAQQPQGRGGQGQPPAPMVVHQLKPNVYWVEGGAGANTGFVVGSSGVVVIDAKQSQASATEMLAEIAKITPKPVTTVILTHSDGDHIAGLPAFPKGVTIIAHQGDKEEQEAAIAAGGRGAPLPEWLPNRVVTKNKEAVTLEGVKFELLHWAGAHTGGDLVVYLPDQKISFTGDIAATNHPFARIHTENGKKGSTVGWVESMKGIIALNAETNVTGHGPLQSKADLQKHVATVEERRQKVKEMVAQGKSIEDVLAALPDSETVPGKPMTAGPQGLSFTEVTYTEFSKKK